MKNTKMKGVKRLSKKLWATLISVTLGVMIAVGGAVAGITLSSKKGGLGGDSIADAVRTGAGTASNPYIIYNVDEWNTTVAASSTNPSSPTYISLGADIVANASNATYSQIFGWTETNDGTQPFYYGALCIPTGKNIVLDLRTYKLDRNLSQAVPYGSVLFAFGNLTIRGTVTYRDNNAKFSDDFTDVTGLQISGGMITGGWNNTRLVGGGLSVCGIGSTTVMESGAIYNNRQTSVGSLEETGVGVHVGSTTPGSVTTATRPHFIFNNGYICYNRTVGSSGSTDGGGIGVGADGYLNMAGGVISWNSNGAGVDATSWGSAMASRNEAVVTGGEVHHNYGQGRGAFAPHLSTISVSNCHIHDNISGGEAAIYLGGNTLTLNNCIIENNISLGIAYTHNALFIAPWGSTQGEQTCHISGKMIIRGNKWRTNENGVAVEKDISYLINSGKVIYVDGPLTNDSDIFLEMEEMGVFTSGFRANSPNIEPTIFSSNLTQYTVAYNSTSGECELRDSLPTDAWNDTVKRAVGSNSMTYTMTADFVGTNNNLGTGAGFGATDDRIGTGTGGMRVPSDATIVLNMAGNTINRNINTAIDDGSVIKVFGTLTINTSGSDPALITGGNTKGNGGGIYVAKGGRLFVNGANIKICKNKADLCGGGIYVEQGGTVYLGACTIGGTADEGNYAAAQGGGVYAEEGGDIQLYNATVVKNNLSGMDFDDNLHLVSGNKVTIMGGLVAGDNDNYVGITLEDGAAVFTDNESYAMYVNRFKSDNDILYSVELDGTRNAKLVSNTYYSIVQKWNLTVKKSIDHGGAFVRFDLNADWIGADGSMITGDGLGNTTNYGFKDGALYVPSNARINFYVIGTHRLDRRQTTETANGAVIIVDGTLAIRSGSLTIMGGNTTGNGGAINNNGTLSVFGNVNISSNKAQGNGGGIYNNGTMTMSNTSFAGNSAADGSAIYSAKQFVANNLTVTGNIATGGGNSAAVVCSSGNTNFSGIINITNNTRSADNSKANLSASNGFVVNNLSVDSKIGVTVDGAQTLTSGLGAADLNYVESIFTSDSDEYILSILNGEGYIGTKVTEPELAFESTTYNGQAQTFVTDSAAVEALIGPATTQGKAYTVSVKRTWTTNAGEEKEETLSNVNVLSLTEAGAYEITFTLNDGYLWASADKRGENSITLNVLVRKASVTVPEANRPVIASNIYVGQKINTITVSNGRADCADTNQQDLAGVWKAIPEDGVITANTTSVSYTFIPSNDNIAPYEGSIAKEPVGFTMTVTNTSPEDGSAVGTPTVIHVDYQAQVTVSYGTEGDNTYAYFGVVVDGEPATERVLLGRVPGYTPYIYQTGALRPVPIENGDSRLYIDGNRRFSIGYTPNEGTKYTIYYLTQYEGAYQSFETRAELDEYAVDHINVFRYGAAANGTGEGTDGSPTGRTTDRVVLVNSDDTPLIAFPGRDDTDQFVIDWGLTGDYANATINGDGSTWVVVYLKGREYDITFEPNGARTVYYPDGTVIDGKDVSGQAISFTYKAKYSDPITPPVTDEQMVRGDGNSYTFLGWFTVPQPENEADIDQTKKVNFNSSVTVEKDETFYAYWSINPFHIDYNKDEKDPTYTARDYDIVSNAMTHNQPAIHFTYVGADGNTDEPKNAYFPIDWSACESNPETYYTSPDRIYLASPSAVGFRFGGWYRVYRNASGEITRSAMITYIERGTSGDIELYARWIPAAVSVSFNANGDGASATASLRSFTNMNTYGTLPTASRSGYQFMGWFTNKAAADAVKDVESEADIVTDDMVNASMTVALPETSTTFYAAWRPIKYSYSYTDNSEGGITRGTLIVQKLDEDGNLIGEIAEGEEIEYGTKINIIVTPRSGYTIDSIRNGNTPIVNNVPRTVTGNIDIRVTFVPQTYTIRYDYDGGRAVNGESSFIKRFSIETANTYLPGCEDRDTQTDIARTGYRFTNWKLLADDTALTDLDSVRARFDAEHPLRNITLVATWEAKTLHVFLHKQDGTGSDSPDPVEGTLEEDVVIPKVSRENYILLGWATRPNSNSIAVSVGTDPDNELTYGIGSYSLKAEDYTGLEADNSINHLYAVWHIAGAQAMILESPATDAVYSGKPYTITARPLFPYTQDPTIVLQYQWYKDGVPVGNRITRTIADVQELGVQKWVEVEYQVTNVSDSGVYECRLTATGNVGGSTYSSGTGEIEISISRAEYSNMEFSDGSVTYNGEVQTKVVMYGTPNPDGTVDFDQPARNYIEIGSDRNDWIGVRYSYTLNGVPVANIRAAGVYEVTATFTVPSTSNYQDIPDHTCMFTVNRLTITQVEYSIVSVGADGTETEVKNGDDFSFDNPYNKLSYKVIANPVGVFGGDDVTVGITNNVQVNVGNYEAAIDGTLTGDDADNYVLEVSVGGTVIYRILKGDHDISNVTFDETVKVTYDANLHEVYLETTVDGAKVQVKDGETFKDKNGFDLTLNYTISYQENYSGFTPASDAAATLNGGYSAGEYVITATFTDDDIANFNALSDRTCTLTIEQRDFFAETNKKESMLGDFKTTSVSYDPDTYVKLFINGSFGDMDFNGGLFTVSYVYEKLAGSSYSEIITGDEAAIRGDATFTGLRDSGYYRLTAKISYNVDGADAAALALANNYQAIDDIVIDYTVANGVVDSIAVTFVTGAEFWYGEDFDRNNIESILVTYKGTNSDGTVDENAAKTTENFTDRNWINGTVIYEGSEGENLFVSFNHVGSYDVRIGFLGEIRNYTVSVKQNVSDVIEWQYSTEGGDDDSKWTALPADGIEYVAGGYYYRAVFSGAGTAADSVSNDLKTTATVVDENADINSGKFALGVGTYRLCASDVGNYVFRNGTDDVTGELVIKKNTQITAQWYFGSTKIEEAQIIYSGADFVGNIKVMYDLGDGRGLQEHSWKTGGVEIIHAKKYELEADELPSVKGGDNYELQGLKIEITVAPKEVPFVSDEGYGWQYFDGTDWVELPVSLGYKGADYRIRILAKDGANDVEIAVAGAPLSGGDDVAIRNAGNYRLRGANSDYIISGSQNTRDFVIQKHALTVTWKYGEDDEQFVYDGKEQTLLGTVSGVGEDAGAEIVEITGNTGTNAIDYTARATLTGDYADNYSLRSGDYEDYGWKIDKRNVELTWSGNEFGYNGSVQVPEIIGTNAVEGEELTIRVSYKRNLAYGLTEDVEEINVVTVEEYGYTAVPTFNGDPAVLANYSFNNVDYKFDIIKSAPAITGVTYEEYLTNITYQVENQGDRGLREDKLVATFGGTPVAGRFVFLDGDGNPMDGKSVDLTQTSTTGTAFKYSYIPDDTANYNSYDGEITIMIVPDGVVTGDDALIIDLRIKQYTLGSGLNFAGTRIYLKYASFYEENGVRYGKYVQLQQSDVDFMVAGFAGTVESYRVLDSDVPETGFGTKTLEAELKLASKPEGYENRNFAGKTTFIVTKDIPIGMRYDEAKSDFRTVWYVDEIFSTEGLVFELDYGAGKQPGEMAAENVTCTLNGTKFTEANPALDVEFSFLSDENGNGGVRETITIEVREREYLQVNYSKSNNLLAYEDGNDIDWESEYGITFTEDDETKTEVDGVYFDYVIRKRDENNRLVQVSKINEIGVYQIEVQFIINNPRYFSFVQNAVEFSVEVTELVYTIDADFTAFTEDELNVEYKGEAYAFNTTTKPTVYDKNGNAVSPSLVRVTYSYNGETDSSKWDIKDVGSYEIVLKVEVNDAKLGWRELNPVTYTVTVSRATTEIKSFTIGQSDGRGNYYLMEGVSVDDVENAVSIVSTFGTPTSYRYRPLGGTWANGLPTAVGKYEVEVTILGNDNFTTANSTAQSINAIFEIRKGSIGADDGNGSSIEIENKDNGIDYGVEIKFDKIQPEDLAELSVRRQVVLDGYDVNLVSEGVTVQPNGDVTVRVKLGAEFADRTDLNVYLYDEETKTSTRLEAQVDENGYLVFTTDTLGRILITEAAVTTPAGLIAGVSVGAVVAAALIVACVLVFLKKRSK